MPFRVIPVIDLLGGTVVRGVAGQRSNYQPVVSKLCHDATPQSVADAFARQFGFNEAYVADLDAITGAGDCVRCYDQILAAGFDMLLDAGIANAVQAKGLVTSEWFRDSAIRLVIGLESIASLAELQRVVKVVAPTRCCFSLDLKRGVPITNAADLVGMNAEAIAARVHEIGIGQMIVLDLAAVGVNGGVPTIDLCRRLASSYADLELISGGGVRGERDLVAMAGAGIRGALVATALHDGTITPEIVARVARF